MDNEDEIDNMMIAIYNAYGSSSGVLFGIPSDLKPSVRAVMKLVINKKNVNAFKFKYCIN